MLHPLPAGGIERHRDHERESQGCEARYLAENRNPGREMKLSSESYKINSLFLSSSISQKRGLQSSICEVK